MNSKVQPVELEVADSPPPAYTEKEAAGKDGYTPGGRGDPYLGFRIAKQAALVGAWICIGLYAEISGPTLPDLKDRLGVNYEEVTRALIGRDIGLLVGAIGGGLLNERFYKHTDFLIGGGLLIAAVGTFVTPFSSNLAVVAFMFVLGGLAEGIINTGGNAMVMHMFGENTASPMCSLHFGFGLGALLAPQIARPFLSPDDDTTNVTYGNETVTMDTSVITTQATNAFGDNSRIEIPYCIIGGLVAAFALVMFGFGVKGNPAGVITHVPRSNIRAMFNPGSCARGNTRYGLELFICIFFYFIQAAGGERAAGKFLFSFALESEVAMQRSSASNLQTTFWACHTGGRLLGTLVSRFVALRYVMGGDVIGVVVTSVVLAFLGHNNRTALWATIGVFGLFLGVCFPNGMSWANLHLEMNSMGVMVCMVGASVGGFTYQYMTGSLFERDPRNLMFVLVAYAVCLGVVFIVMQVMVTVRKKSVDKFQEEQEQNKAEVFTVSKDA